MTIFRDIRVKINGSSGGLSVDMVHGRYPTSYIKTSLDTTFGVVTPSVLLSRTPPMSLFLPCNNVSSTTTFIPVFFS